jgi:serine/threonine-protein kinase RsbW
LAGNKIETYVCNAVEICLTEALNNVIKHAYKGENSNQIEIIIRINNNQLEIDIIDEGSPRKNLIISELNFDPTDIDNLPEGGMGLYIIKQLMDDLNYYSLNGKNYFTLRKQIF